MKSGGFVAEWKRAENIFHEIGHQTPFWRMLAREYDIRPRGDSPEQIVGKIERKPISPRNALVVDLERVVVRSYGDYSDREIDAGEDFDKGQFPFFATHARKSSESIPVVGPHLEIHDSNRKARYVKKPSRECLYCGTLSARHCLSREAVSGFGIYWNIRKLPKLEVWQLIVCECSATADFTVRTDLGVNGIIFDANNLRCPRCNVYLNKSRGLTIEVEKMDLHMQAPEQRVFVTVDCWQCLAPVRLIKEVEAANRKPHTKSLVALESGPKLCSMLEFFWDRGMVVQVEVPIFARRSASCPYCAGHFHELGEAERRTIFACTSCRGWFSFRREADELNGNEEVLSYLYAYSHKSVNGGIGFILNEDIRQDPSITKRKGFTSKRL